MWISYFKNFHFSCRQKLQSFFASKLFVSHITMGKEILTFGNIRVEKKSYRHKGCVPLRDADIEKVLLSNKISLGEKTISTFLVICLMIIKLSHCL